jgi:hypothetical protein
MWRLWGLGQWGQTFDFRFEAVGGSSVSILDLEADGGPL